LWQEGQARDVNYCSSLESFSMIEEYVIHRGSQMVYLSKSQDDDKNTKLLGNYMKGMERCHRKQLGFLHNCRKPFVGDQAC